MLADAATPVALFTIGAVLWRAGQHAHYADPAAQYVPVALARSCCTAAGAERGRARACGRRAGIGAFRTPALVLIAALLSASNVSPARRAHEADNGRVARIIMTPP